MYIPNFINANLKQHITSYLTTLKFLDYKFGCIESDIKIMYPAKLETKTIKVTIYKSERTVLECFEMNSGSLVKYLDTKYQNIKPEDILKEAINYL